MVSFVRTVVLLVAAMWVNAPARQGAALTWAFHVLGVVTRAQDHLATNLPRKVLDITQIPLQL